MNLVSDLKSAIEAANAIEHDGDGGTCNFDSLAIKVPSNSKKVIYDEALREVGLSAWLAEDRPWKGYFIVSPPNGGQGSYRTRQAEAMKKVLHDKGYEVTVYYQMD